MPLTPVMGEVGRHCSQAWLSMQWDGLKTPLLRWEEAGLGWKHIHFSLYLENISVGTQRNQMAPWGHKAILSLLLFPRPCALGGSAPGHTVSVLQLFCMQQKHHSCTKVREMDKRNIQPAWKTKDQFFDILWMAVVTWSSIFWWFPSLWCQ